MISRSLTTPCGEPIRPIPSARAAGAAVTPELERDIGDLRIARAGDYFARMGSPEAFAAVDAVAAALGVRQTVTIPEAHRARAGGFRHHDDRGRGAASDRLRTQAQDFDPEVRYRLIAGAMLPASGMSGPRNSGPGIVRSY